MGFDIGACKSEILKILNRLISCIWFGLICVCFWVEYLFVCWENKGKLKKKNKKGGNNDKKKWMENEYLNKIEYEIKNQM